MSWMLVSVASVVSGAALSDTLPEEAGGLFLTQQASGVFSFALVFSVVVTLLGYSEGLYENPRPNPAPAGIIAKSVGWTTVITTAAVQLSQAPYPELSWIPAGAALDACGLFAWRRWLARAPHSARCTRRVVIVGAGDTGRALARHLDLHPELRTLVCGFLDDHPPSPFRVLGRVDALATVARAEFADEVLISVPGDPALAARVVEIARAQHLDVRAVPDFFGTTPVDPCIERCGDIPLVALHREQLPAGALMAKRAMDLVLGTLALLLAAPLMLLTAVAVVMDSPGPAIYAATRVGRKGQRFRCFKFRTMTRDADDGKDALRALNQREGPCFKVEHDPRITRIGHFLRRYSIDEFPQLWNVLRGEMSLVGPRPHPVDDYERYTLEHLRRLDMTPGMTGLWQVSARQNPSFQAAMSLDLEYIENWSLTLDLRILFRTLAVVLSGTGV